MADEIPFVPIPASENVNALENRLRYCLIVLVLLILVCLALCLVGIFVLGMNFPEINLPQPEPTTVPI